MNDRPEPLEALAPGAIDRRVARGMFIVAGFAVLTSVARLGQDAAIAWRYGPGPAVDAYYFIANLVNWPVTVTLSVMTLLIIPIEAALLRSSGSHAVRQFRQELLAAMLVVTVVSLPFSWWLLVTIAGTSLGGLDSSTASLALAGIPVIVISVPIGLTGALLAAWLISAGQHTLTLFEAVPSLVLILALLAIPGIVLFWGTSVGAGLQVAIMAAVLASLRELPRPRFSFTSPAWTGIASGAFMLVLAQVISAMLPLVDAFFAARLGEGTLATLNFANRMVLGIQGLAALGLQRVGLPVLSKLGAAAPSRARSAALRWAALMGGAGLIAGLAVALLADPLVTLLLERGRFTPAHSEQVATLLRWGMLQLVPFLAGMAVVVALASAGAWGTLVVTGGAGLVVKIGASAVLAPAYGAVGLQISTALMYATVSSLAWLALRRRLHDVE